MNSSFAIEFVDALAAVRMPDVFNPYCDYCRDWDLPNAPAIRRSNLRAALRGAADSRAEILWVGLELGRRGGRRTGLPLTDEPRLSAASAYWGAALRRATQGEAMTEQTASYVWQAVHHTRRRVFFWNIFPFHCHQSDSTTNRNHTRDEAEEVANLLPWLISAIKPQEIVALGRSSHIGLSRAGLDARYVRHPGRGGGQHFLETILGEQT